MKNFFNKFFAQSIKAMAGGIDTSGQKPRRLKGTPALRFVNRYSFLILTICSGIGYGIS